MGIFLAGLQFISVRYLGDNLVLLTGEDDTDMKKVIEENSEWLSMVFTSLQPWTEDIGPRHKIVWVRCRGIPLYLWNEECFRILTASVGTLIDIDKNTMTWERLEYARLKVRLPIGSDTKMYKKMTINGNLYNVHLEEEITVAEPLQCQCHMRSKKRGESVSSSTSSRGRFMESSESEYLEIFGNHGTHKNSTGEDGTFHSPEELNNDNNNPDEKGLKKSTKVSGSHQNSINMEGTASFFQKHLKQIISYTNREMQRTRTLEEIEECLIQTVGSKDYEDQREDSIYVKQADLRALQSEPRCTTSIIMPLSGPAQTKLKTKIARATELDEARKECTTKDKSGLIEVESEKVSDTVDSIFPYLALEDFVSEKNSIDKETITGTHMVLIKETKLDP